MQRRHLLLAILTASTLGACGFRLKGTGGGIITLDAPLRLTLPAQEKDNARVIREVFAERGLIFDDTASDGYEIILDEFADTRFESAVGGQYGQSRVLDLRKGFTATIRKNGQTLASQPLSSERSTNYHSEQYLGNLADDERAQHAMQRDNAEKLLRFFQATIHSQ